MTTATKNGQEEKITALYARLSDDDPIEKKQGWRRREFKLNTPYMNMEILTIRFAYYLSPS